jgi:hypothetical protein
VESIMTKVAWFFLDRSDPKMFVLPSLSGTASTAGLSMLADLPPSTIATPPLSSAFPQPRNHND